MSSLHANFSLLLVPTEPFGRFSAVKYRLPLARMEIRLLSRAAIALFDSNASVNYRKILGFHSYAMIIKSVCYFIRLYFLLLSKSRCRGLNKLIVTGLLSGFCGLVVSMLASDTQDRRFKPGQSRRIFRAKKSSACLPSEGK
jgi:hypothetical protein